MQFSDEILMAYADGEVDADTRRQIEAAMAHDPSIAQRVAKHRELKADLNAAFDGVLDEEIPSRLLDATSASPLAANASLVTDINAIRTAKLRSGGPRRWSWPEWTSIAASMLIGILAGRSALGPGESKLFATDGNGIVATGELSDALTAQLGGASDDAAVSIGLSFRSTGGEYCRAFTVRSAAGFACHQDDTWKIRALSEGANSEPGSEYRMAGSELPPVIVAAIEGVMEGEALDQDAEKAAQANGWQPK
jgi:hypothetical protein